MVTLIKNIADHLLRFQRLKDTISDQNSIIATQTGRINKLSEYYEEHIDCINRLKKRVAELEQFIEEYCEITVDESE